MPKFKAKTLRREKMLMEHLNKGSTPLGAVQNFLWSELKPRYHCFSVILTIKKFVQLLGGGAPFINFKKEAQMLKID